LTRSEGAGRERRTYEAPRRLAAAMQTRADIAAAARRLFVSRGWAATTVREIAHEAGVSEPTVYKAYGGKTGLALALVDAIDLAADLDRELAELAAASGDPAGQLAAMIAFDRRLYDRGGDVIRLLREAGRTEESLVAAYLEGRARGEQLRQRVFTSWSTVDVPAACDTYAALVNVDVYTTLIEERRWTPDRVETWWHTTLCRLLLP
jgi:AcrR family transcriptional regulator